MFDNQSSWNTANCRKDQVAFVVTILALLGLASGCEMPGNEATTSYGIEANQALQVASKSISPLPDVIVSRISMSPAKPVAGQAVTFSALITNQSLTATPKGVEIGVGFYINGNQTNWASSDRTSLGPGASVTITATGGPSGTATWLAKAGTFTLLANVNGPKRFQESNFDNNTLSQSITVGTGIPSVISVSGAGNNQSGTVATALNQPLNVLVTDSSGDTVAGAKVNWSVTGGGTLGSATSTTGANGIAQNSLTLGKLAGVDTVTATIDGTNTSANFAEKALAGAPASVTANAGTGLTGTAGSSLPGALEALVKDQYENPVTGAQVNWVVTSGGGSLSQAASQTSATGIASNNLVLGKAAGTNTVTATVKGTQITAKFTDTGAPGPASQLAAIGSNTGTAYVGTAAKLSVLAQDINGNATTGTPITWALQGGGGTLSTTSSLTAQGVASSTLTLGRAPGTNTVLASLPGAAASVKFTETGVIPQPIPTGQVTPTTITIAPQTLGAIENNFDGLSFELNIFGTYYTAYDNPSANFAFFSAQNTALIGLFNLLNQGRGGLLRLGGHTEDTYVWNPKGTGHTAYEISPPDIDALVTFIQHTPGWKVLLGVRLYSYESAITTVTPTCSNPPCFNPPVNPDLGIAGDAALDADEVAYASQKLGENLYGIEIGNESDLDVRAYNSEVPNFAEYYARWSQIAQTILKRTQGVMLTGPALGNGTETLIGVAKTPWTEPFIQNAQRDKFNVGLLTQHSYPFFTSGETTQNITLADLFGADGEDAPYSTSMDMLATQLTTLTTNYKVPWRFTEGGAYQKGGYLDTSSPSSLWAVDHLFDIASHGGTGYNWHNGPGTVPGSFAAFGITDAGVVYVNPVFYGMILFGMAGSGNLLQTTASNTEEGLLTAYTVQGADGERDVIVNNKSTQNLQFALNLGTPIQSAQLILMTGPVLNSTMTGPSLDNPLDQSNPTIQGAQVVLPALGSSPMEFNPGVPYGLIPNGTTVQGYVNAGSAALIKVH